MSLFNDEECYLEMKEFIEKYRDKMGEGKKIGKMDWETFRKLDESLPTLSELYEYAKIFRNVFGLEFSYDENRRQAVLRGIDRILWGVGLGDTAMESLRKSLDGFLEKMAVEKDTNFNNEYGYTVRVPNFGSLAELNLFLGSNGLDPKKNIFEEAQRQPSREKFLGKFGCFIIGKTDDEVDQSSLEERKLFKALDETFLDWMDVGHRA